LTYPYNEPNVEPVSPGKVQRYGGRALSKPPPTNLGILLSHQF
jgi:hypothetical protein